MRFLVLNLFIRLVGLNATAAFAQQQPPIDPFGPHASFDVDIGPGWGVSAGLGIRYFGVVLPPDATIPLPTANPLSQDGALFQPANHLGFDMNLTFSFSF